jgi:D-sedoheptulose 7-phosphate isomerase
MKTDIKNSLKITKKVINSMISDKKLIEKIEKSVEICIKCLNKKNKILLAGNGGSAADAQHIAAEFVGRFAFDRQGLAAIALTTDTSVITAISNDYGYEKIYARQIETIGKSGDVFIGYTTSGRSKNIIHALNIAKKKDFLQ